MKGILGVMVLSAAVLARPPRPAAVDSPSLLRRLAAAGSLSDLHWPDFSDYRVHLHNFYEPTNYALAWTRSQTVTRQAAATIEILREADAKGLNAEDYDGSLWDARLCRLRDRQPPSDDDLSRFDLALTVSVMRYVSDLHVGRLNPGWFHSGLDIQHEKYDLAGLVRQLLADASDVKGTMARIDPPFDGYKRTERALQMYLALAREDDGELLPVTQRAVEPGSSYSGVPRLTCLLRRLGDLPVDAAVPSDKYEGVLVEAVKRFQDRHGLDADGRIGKVTLGQLNKPLSHRVRQLQLTLERWRWVPHEFVQPPIVVNIPEFRLRALNNSYRTELEMKVVVGRAYRHQTPVFARGMTCVIFRPYWNVPRSIQRAELLPKLYRNRSYLAEHGYQVVTADDTVVASGAVDDQTIGQLRSGRLLIRQVPGPKNSLGLIKFLFPNEYNVYLHATPATELFAKSRRDFSHGCIRVEHPELLAAWVLKDQPEWTRDHITETMQGAKTVPVRIARPIPVLIVYATAVVPEDGKVRFFEDIYGQDRWLEELLVKGYPYSSWKPTSGVHGPHPHE